MGQKLVWERVNSVTWKLTDGRRTDTPRSHGQWPGFKTSRALGWVMQIDEDCWVGRVTVRGKRMSTGPAFLDAAKEWVRKRAAGVPIARPLPPEAYRMGPDGWSIPLSVALDGWPVR